MNRSSDPFDPHASDAATDRGNQSASASADNSCPRCHRSLPTDSPYQLCPYCLLSHAEGPATGSQSTAAFNRIDPPEPEALQPYFEMLEIGPLIGCGGMGVVYRAHQRSLGRDVALKILLPEVAVTEGFTDRFHREARALARLSHPHVVSVYDHGTAGPFAYLIMELVEGVNLRDLMAGQRLSTAEALRIVPQLCDALQFAHDRGVIHRDIKPENILIEESGHVKITDFGLAKLIEANEDLGRTATRQAMGTLHYMSPEQIERPREVDHRSDLYSLGVVFYELLTGELPLGKFPPPSRKSDASQRIDRVVMRSLEKEPDRRYASASKVREELDSSGYSATETARNAAHAVDARVRSATSRLKESDWRLPSNWSLAATLLATGLFYVLMWFAGMVITGSRDVVPPTFLFACLIWAAAFVLKQVYRSVPVPPPLDSLTVPVLMIANAPLRLIDAVSRYLNSVEGLRQPWLIAGLIAFLVAVGGWIAALGVDDDFIPIALIAMPIAYFCTRWSLPPERLPIASGTRLFIYPQILIILVPLLVAVVAWPIVAWILLVVNLPDWFAANTGITMDFDAARYRSNLRVIKSQVFGGLTIEFFWLSILALMSAVFPEAVRWLARPLLDHWSGGGRWYLFAILASLSIVFSLIWSL